MNKQEFVEKLRMHVAWCTECHDIHGEKDRYVKVAKVRQLLEQLDEPQGEKVVVTEKQAELLRAFKGESIFELLANCLEQDEELMAKAKLFGYTVKPKRWVVKFEQYNEQFYFMNWIDLYSMEPVGYAKKDMVSVMKFTDIKKAEALATLIDGEVEEA